VTLGKTGVMNRRHLVPLVVIAFIGASCSSSQSSDGTSSAVSLTLLPSTTTTSTIPASTSTSTSTTSTTTSTTTPATTTTEVDASVQELVLSGTGIGAAEFGADPDGVVSYIGSFLGKPTSDSGWIDPASVGGCPGTELRLVDWGALTLLFGDVSQVVQGRRHFSSYTYGVDGEVGAAPAGLTTERGITVGSRVVDLKAAYPGVKLNPQDDFTAPSFYVDDNLTGFLTGITDDSTVTVIRGGIGCGE
jgi:hypothetical protein